MGDISFELQDQLTPLLRIGHLDECLKVVSARLSALPPSPFHIALELNITTNAVGVAEWFDGFFANRDGDRKISAAYTEMNGFDINTSRWWFSAFTYSEYGGHEDYDWLSDWQSESDGGVVIGGLEPLQRVYASDAFRDAQYNDACDVTGLLVVIKFQDLIQRAANHMKELKFPLLATAHDYDFIYEARGCIS